MVSNNQALTGTAVGGAQLKVGQRSLPNIRTGAGREVSSPNSFADNLKNIKTKLARQDVFSGSTNPSLPTTVKCELPSQPLTTAIPEMPSVTRCEMPQVKMDSVMAQIGFKSAKP